MRPTSLLALGFVLAHAVTVTALSWPNGWLGLLALLCWGFAAVGAGEPQPTRSPRHRDVAAAERTALGRRLMYREGWIIERPVLSLALIVLVSLLAATTLMAMAPIERTPLMIARIFVWAPAVLLGAGFILSTMVNMWIVTGPILGFWLLFVVASVLTGDHGIALRLVAWAAGAIAALFCVDLLRGARRGLARARSTGPAPE